MADIRENVQLLDLMEVIDNKEDLRLDKFTDKETGKQYDFFTNFILTIKTNSGQKLVARTIKNTSELNRKITIERLEIERRYFEAKSVEWKIITDKQINKQLCKNIEWVRETLLGDDIGIDKDEYAKGLYNFILSSKEIILNKVLKEYEIRESLEKGTGLYLFRYLIAKKDIEIDMYKKVDISLKVDELIEKFNTVYIINLNEEKWPYPYDYIRLVDELKEEKIKVIEDTFVSLITDDTLSENEIDKREFAWEVMSFIHSKDEASLYISKYRTAIIKETMKIYNISFNTIKKYIIRYWKAGKVKNGLVPLYSKCGGRGIDKPVGNKKRGRPSSINEGINVDTKVRDKFQKGLNKYYYNSKEINLKTVYELTVRDFFINEGLKIPSYHQFYYWYKKLNNEKRGIKARQGERIYYQKYRPLTGNSIMDAELGVAHVWQIDSTIGDLYIASEIDRDLIVGRPIVYLVIDVYSRMIVGVNVTLESFNSYTGAMCALINAMTDKVDYCKKYGIEITKEEWNVNCIPQRILADRGEIVGEQIERAISNLGITIQNTPAYRADFKGCIEQAFKQLNLKYKPFVGSSIKNGINRISRGDEDYRLKASITLNEFTNIVIKCILFYNNYHVLSDYISDEILVDKNIEKIPKNIWNFGLESKKGFLRKLPEDIIKINLLPSKLAKISSKGILFNKMIYWSEYLLNQGLIQEARKNGRISIKVSYDPRDLSKIYYLEEDGRTFHTLTLVDYLEKYKGLSEAEIDFIINKEKEINEKAKERELKHKLKLYDEIESIVANATGEQKSLKKNISKRQRLNGIKENNKIEKLLHRESIDISEKHNEVEESIVYEVSESNNEVDLFEKLQEEMWRNLNE